MFIYNYIGIIAEFSGNQINEKTKSKKRRFSKVQQQQEPKLTHDVDHVVLYSKYLFFESVAAVETISTVDVIVD